VTKPRTLRPPALLLHKASGRAYVMARDEQGARRAIFLGEHGSAASERSYRQFLADFYAGNPLCKPQPKDAPEPGAFTVENLCTEFLIYAESRYRREDGSPTGEALNFAHAFRDLLDLYRDVPAASFDVPMLEAVQGEMVRRGLARTVVNSRVGRIRRAFRWGARKKLLPATVWHELQALPGLRRGEHAVRESKPVEPIPQEEIDEILPHMTPTLAAMITLMTTTGGRPGEIACMRMTMLDRADPNAWIFRPPHKNSWRGQDRMIPLLSADQNVLRPFLRLDDRPLFQPGVAERSRGRAPRRDMADAYSTHAIGKGIRRAVQAANAERVRRRLRELLAVDGDTETATRIGKLTTRQLIANSGSMRADVAKVLAGIVPPPRMEAVLRNLAALPMLEPFGPNRIRHLAATRAAPIVGDDGVQLLLGHADGRTLKHYVQRDPKRVVDIRKRLGVVPKAE